MKCSGQDFTMLCTALWYNAGWFLSPPVCLHDGLVCIVFCLSGYSIKKKIREEWVGKNMLWALMLLKFFHLFANFFRQNVQKARRATLRQVGSLPCQVVIENKFLKCICNSLDWGFWAHRCQWHGGLTYITFCLSSLSVCLDVCH